MSKKIKYYISYTVDAMARTVVEGPEGLSAEEVMDLVDEQNAHPYASVCHQCSDNVEVADVIEEVEIINENGLTVWDKWTDHKKKLKRLNYIIGCVESLSNDSELLNENTRNNLKIVLALAKKAI